MLIEWLDARTTLLSNASFEKIDVENLNRKNVIYARLYILGTGTPDLYDHSIELQLCDHMHNRSENTIKRFTQKGHIL